MPVSAHSFKTAVLPYAAERAEGQVRAVVQRPDSTELIRHRPLEIAVEETRGTCPQEGWFLLAHQILLRESSALCQNMILFANAPGEERCIE